MGFKDILASVIDSMDDEELDDYIAEKEDEANEAFFKEHGYWPNIIDTESMEAINPLYWDELED